MQSPEKFTELHNVQHLQSSQLDNISSTASGFKSGSDPLRFRR